MMASTLADSASRSPSRLSDNPSKKRLCLQANAATIASTYTYAGFNALYDPGREPGPITPVVNRRPKRTPYRRAKGTPFVEQRDGYDGRFVRAGCGVGRA